MTHRYSKTDFKRLYDVLFHHLTQREWRIAGELAADCRDYINQAFIDGYRDVANYGLSRLDDLVTPNFTDEYRDTQGYGGLWKLKEMHRFIIFNLDFKPQQAVELIDGVTKENADRVVARLICVGVLEHALHHPDDDRAPLTGHFSLKVSRKLSDIGCKKQALELLVALANAEEVERSDLFVDKDFVEQLALLGEHVPDSKQTYEELNEPLLNIIDAHREQGGYDHSEPNLNDVLKVAELGARTAMRKVFIEGSYGENGPDLRQLEKVFGAPFSRGDIILMRTNFVQMPETTTAWLKTVLSYWLDNQEMVWPYAHGYKESISTSFLVKSPTSNCAHERLAEEVVQHAKVMDEVFKAHPFENEQERDQVMGRVINLYLQGHSDEEAEICARSLASILPKRVVLTTSRFRDNHFSGDLGL